LGARLQGLSRSRTGSFKDQTALCPDYAELRHQKERKGLHIGRKTMLRKLIGAGAILLLLTGAAAAQFPMPGISFGGDNKKKLTPEEQEAQNKRDKDYKAAMDKIPEKKATNDPWGNVRDAGSSTPAKKP
jgi:hypothetical protein